MHGAKKNFKNIKFFYYENNLNEDIMKWFDTYCNTNLYVSTTDVNTLESHYVHSILWLNL